MAGNVPGARVATPADDVVLELRDLHLSYGRQAVLRGVNLRLRRGSISVLLGPNGAGKTTLIRAACGRLMPKRGDVCFAGAAGDGEGSRLGLVPQEIAVYPHLTPRENLRFFGRMAGLGGERLRVAIRTTLALARLDSRADQLTRTLSGGYQRRVNIAAAILNQPAVLILDEPMVGVDPEAREALGDVIRGLAAEGMAVLMTSHDLDQTERLGDRVCVLVNGRIAAEGPPRELVAEIFGDRREAGVVLEGPATPAIDAVLRACDLVPGEDGASWSGVIAGGPVAMRRLVERLESLEVEVREVRIRRPDLASLYRRLTGNQQGLA